MAMWRRSPSPGMPYVRTLSPHPTVNPPPIIVQDPPVLISGSYPIVSTTPPPTLSTTVPVFVQSPPEVVVVTEPPHIITEQIQTPVPVSVGCMECGELRMRLEEAQERGSNLETQILQLSTDNTTLRSELDTWLESREGEGGEELGSIIRQLNDDLRVSRQEVEDVRNQLDRKEDTIMELRNQLRDARQAEDNCMKSKEGLMRRIWALEEELNSAKTVVAPQPQSRQFAHFGMELADGIRYSSELGGKQHYGWVKVVSASGPVAQAGLEKSDLIQSIEGKPMTCLDDVRSVVSSVDPNKPISMVVERDGREISMVIQPETTDELPGSHHRTNTVHTKLAFSESDEPPMIEGDWQHSDYSRPNHQQPILHVPIAKPNEGSSGHSIERGRSPSPNSSRRGRGSDGHPHQRRSGPRMISIGQYDYKE